MRAKPGNGASKSARTSPEAELEVMLSAALARAFPSIPRREFSHQKWFTITLGHNSQKVDGTRDWRLAGRADIILRYSDRPLAVVELKREGLALTDDDRRQGQSYANQLTPRPPLVIVTNGKECRLFDSATGTEWEPDSPDGEAVAKLFANAAKIAANNLDWAIDVLMGPEGGVWPGAVRHRTRQLIDQLSGMAWDQSKPFVADFLIPRLGTIAAKKQLDAGRRIVLVTGPPLSGKSNVLRELAERTVNSDDFAVFMIRGGAAGPGLFQRIANTLSAALEWAVTADDIRHWLRRLSNGKGGPALVLAIDGVVVGSALAVELEELAEAGFGPRLRILATTDDARNLLIGANGRDRTALADHASVIDIEPLNQAEFRKAQEALANHNIGLEKGADFADEYRAPWLLRWLLADVVKDPRHGDHGALLTSSLGVLSVDVVRSKFAGFDDASHGYRLLARDFVADATKISGELALEISYGFAVRRDALQQPARELIGGLSAHGWLRTYRHPGGEDVLVPRAPDLFLSEVALAVSEELERRVAVNARNAGQWLADRLEGVFLGDIIGAQAIRDLAARQGRFSSAILAGLYDREPTTRPFKEGVVAFQKKDGTLQDLRINGDGTATLLDEAGSPLGAPIDLEDETMEMLGGTVGWMILAQFARIPTAVDDDDRQGIGASILLDIGGCPVPLLRASRDPVGHLVHDVPGHGSVLCTDNGVIEPATAAMQQLFLKEWDRLDPWFDEALSQNSLALLNRILIALRQVRQLSTGPRRDWANAMLENRVDPAIASILKPMKKGAPSGPRSIRPKPKSRSKRRSR